MTRQSAHSTFALAACLLVACVLLLPPSADGAAKILDVHEALEDFDSRTETIEPSASQIATVANLGATARWNRFGTVHSLIKHGGALGSGYSSNPAVAARAWLRNYSGLFALSGGAVDQLELLNVSPFAGNTEGQAVIFRQRFGGLPAADGGLITVGVSGGKIFYASSSSAGEQSAPAPAAISATDAWLAAAAGAGLAFSRIDISEVREENGWTVLEVAGLSHPQRARPVAFPTVVEGVLPAFETIVLHNEAGLSLAYTVFVDAQTSAVLARYNRVYQLAASQGRDLLSQSADAGRGIATRAQETQVFQGAYQDAPAAPTCGTYHGPYSVPTDFLRIVVTASAAVIGNDIFIELHYLTQGNLVATGDLATSPETLQYEPSGGVPPGDYYVRICPFQPPPAPPVAPYNYAGTITWEDTDPPNAFTVPQWDLFLANPPLDGSGIDTRTLACWTLVDFEGVPVPGCEYELQNLAARGPWDHDYRANTATFTTTGNAARSAEAWGSPLTPAEGYQPVSPTRAYAFEWLNSWQTSTTGGIGPAGCSQTVFTAPGVTNANDIDAATANLFGMHNRMHDWSYYLGFTERNYNLQSNNFGNTSPDRENDPEIGNVQAGAVSGGAPSYLGRDNANQITLNDGIPGITNMYLWQPIAAAFYPPCVDGDYDMAVIGHEYTHAISNRMIGGPDANIGGDQGGAMGEAWSDLVAVEYLNEYGLVPTNGEHPFSLGAYVTGNGESGIRNYNMSRNIKVPQVVSAVPLSSRNPLNYSNVGYDVTGVQSHADAEIWSATNYDLRQLLVQKYNGQYPASDAALQKRCADGNEFVEHCPGNRRWIQILFDAFLLAPQAPSMLDARDAYLAADMMRFNGANQTELWRGFARRGMGVNAVSLNSDDGQPVPNFESPLEGEATFRFRVLDAATGNPVEAEIYVGHYEARSTPVADTIAATLLGDSAAFTANITHDFLVRADGYGHVRFPRFVWQGFVGSTRTLTVRMSSNLASIHNGATASGDGVNLDKLIDDTEATNWASLTAPVVGDTVVVDLAGGTHSISRVQVSAMLRPTDANDAADSAAQSRFTALRQFEVLTCADGQNPANLFCSGALFPAGFSSIYVSPADAFPAGRPRPLAPDIILREFAVPPTDASHVALRVLHSQCTGAPEYQGEQDADPLNDTDCDTVSANGGRVRAAEFQVFGAATTVPPKDPAVLFTMSGPATAQAGEEISFTLTYENLGPFDSSNASITDFLPAGLEFVSASGGGSYDASTGTVSWDLGTVAVGPAASVTLTARVAPGTTAGTALGNQAEYTADLTVATPAAAVTVVVP